MTAATEPRRREPHLELRADQQAPPGAATEAEGQDERRVDDEGRDHFRERIA